MQEEQSRQGFLALGGPAGLLAILVGLIVLALGTFVAAKRGPRRHALALFAAAWLAVPLGLLGRSFGELTALAEIVKLGAAVTPKDMAGGLQSSSGATACATLGLLLGLVGAVAALARSREDGPEARSHEVGPEPA